MKGAISTYIDPERCNGCGRCVTVCPSRAISLVNGKAAITGERSFACGHCAAVCPTDAIRIADLDDQATSFRTFSQDDCWLPPGSTSTADLVHLMRSRRSIRAYQEKTVSRTTLEELVKIGVTAPSGTNSQRWTFTIIPSRSEMIAFGHLVADFYRRLNQLAAKRWLRNLLKIFGRRELAVYYQEYFQTIREGLAEWDDHGIDRLFHGAPAAILVGSRPGASCPQDDALLATQNILLAAHTMGLGTCLIGFAVEAMKREKKIGTALGIPGKEPIYSVIALGYPAVAFQRPAGRKKIVCRYYEIPLSSQESLVSDLRI
ncbi:MAG: nitroreductase family protein [Deltaproteobacteria bacterium]|nr:nitroreductase family protein [Candidatus Anaeroferrophillus wilburensis]MBN2887723.1 nitroreductase family protein [Deltaproteobacteria bacterium]